MWLIVGLGNPGSKYQMTRHNIGFLCLDYWLESLGNKSPRWKKDHHSENLTFDFESEKICVVKPQTFMNLSGQAVQSLMTFYKIPLNKVIVIHDEVDQPFGAMKVHKNRGHAGHNGIRNISQVLGNTDYGRLRLGVGRPTNPEIQVGDFVLQNFSSEELGKMPEFLGRGCDALEMMVKEGVDKAATMFNGTGK
jgi:peptidyl-tRNA hydrolase, PTH1 family